MAAEAQDKTLDAFQKLVPHLRGALWWVRNDLLKARQSTFNQEDRHVGHPALSVRNRPIANRYEPIPMLMGTSGRSLSAKERSVCVKVVNMTAEEPDHPSYFGSIIEPGQYALYELLDGVVAKDNIEVARKAKVGSPDALQKVAWHKLRVMHPNWHKPMVDVNERTALNNFCMKHGI